MHGQSQESSFEIKVKKVFPVWWHPCKYPKTNYRGSYEISDKYYQWLFERITFPDKLKQSEVIPVYKKLDHLQKDNYGPVSLLPHISKVFERIIYKQINSFMENKNSKCVMGFRKSWPTTFFNIHSRKMEKSLR